ncbi:heat shock factor protein [Halyomorpha halys]|uniref:heat shock factor protein n=1 Tax=Halyomorpha halys TaxID=286706 RepID=UPI0006D50CD7|nr:heat shock factor protein [Halyomorpha halys]
MFSGPESTTVTAFVAKLWQMVCDPKYNDLISWCDKGNSFVIKDQTRFCSELLPMFYKHNNMASFIRQLNKYGFRKVNSPVTSASLKGDVSDFEFSHPHFIKDCPFLLDQIKRKVSSSRDISEFKNDQGLLTKLLLEVQQLQQKQSAFESRISSMKAENDALWREHSILRQKHQKQQKIVNRLIHFLLSLVHQTRGVNVKRRNMPLMLKDGTCLSIEGLEPPKDRHYTTNSPVICEIDPDEISTPTKSQQLSNNPTNIDVIIPVQTEEDNLLTDQLDNADQIFLEVPTSSAIALPMEEVPTIVLESNIEETKPVDNLRLSIPPDGQSNKSHNKRPHTLLNDKYPAKVRKITPSIQNVGLSKMSATSSGDVTLLNIKPISQKGEVKILLNKKTGSKPHIKGVKKKPIKSSRNRKMTLEAIDLLNNDTVHEKFLKEDPEDTQKLDSEVEKLESDVTSVDLFNDDIDYPLESSSLLSSDPIILSPSGTEITSSFIEKPVKDKNTNNSLVLSDNNTTLTKQDVESHIDLMQSDIDALKEILHGEGLSLDASAIMGLFTGDDPISLNMPEAGKEIDNLNPSPVGNELVSYSSPSLIDFADSLNDDESITNSPSFIDEISSTLNTPQVSYGIDFSSPSPSKRLMKSISSLLDLLQKAA